MEFRILGPLEVVVDGRPLELGGARPRALLAVLLLNANEVVSTDRLIDDLWGTAPPATAAHTIHVYVSQLRKLLGDSGDVIVTRRPGYMIRLEPGQLDLDRFEQLLDESRDAFTAASPEAAGAKLREALEIWRGAPLADFAFEQFADAAIRRLEELRLCAIEDRVEADLATGKSSDLVPDLEALVSDHPLRERLRGQLMTALYRSGRQAEALEAYQATRRTLVEHLGIEPGPALQALERAILNQDPDLDGGVDQPAGRVIPTMSDRSILVFSRDAAELEALLALGEPLSRSSVPHELMLARFADGPEDLSAATAELAARRTELLDRGAASRAVAFTSSDYASDLARLASQQEVDLLLLDGRPLDSSGSLSAELRQVLEEALCDVAILASGPGTREGAVLVPFGGGLHDWSALELAAWISLAGGRALRLLGTAADPKGGRRDASRLLGSASLAVQRLSGVPTESVLAPAGADGIAAAAEEASLVVLGVSERWRREGIGETRAKVATRSPATVVLVRGGHRPGGLSPHESLTRFTWSLSRPSEDAPSCEDA